MGPTDQEAYAGSRKFAHENLHADAAAINGTSAEMRRQTQMDPRLDRGTFLRWYSCLKIDGETAILSYEWQHR
jgi:hypothetical protein